MSWGQAPGPVPARQARGGPLLRRVELERERVHAVTEPRRTRPVGKDVAEVGVAGRAAGLDPAHAVARVDVLVDRVPGRRREEARPAGARLELGLAREQLGTAGGAAVD